MIIVKILGGLGNQLFQYAFGRRLANSLDVPLKLDITAFNDYKLHDYALCHFNVIEEFASPEEIKRLKGVGRLLRFRRYYEELVLPFYKRTYVKERCLDFDADIMKISGDAYLDGFWQSEAYFKDIENLIRKDFTLRTSFGVESLTLLSEIQNTNAVCLHVRRGDYVNNPQTNMFHGTLSMNYYSKAIAIIADRVFSPKFFVFTDDQNWAMKNIRISYPVKYVSHNGRSRNYEDMMLMSNCQHFIIANSTFSWWGAWLGREANKIVIAPAKWYKSDIKGYLGNSRYPDQWVTL